MSSVGAVVAYAPEDGKIKWQYEQIPAPRQPKEREILVRMVAAGICHTDIVVSSLPDLPYPKIMGHEGAGYVEAVGPGVTVAAVGDPVLLSYNYCGACAICGDEQQPYCEKWGELNVPGAPDVFGSQDKQGPWGKFFGQSSFASMSVVDEKSVVNVKDHLQTFEELKRCAPMGCGLMTGAGASLTYLKPYHAVMVTGLGAVGMGAIMTAKQMGIKTIIAVDRVDSRLSTAKELGATHLYNNANKELDTFVKDVRGLVDGQRISHVFDTTGFVPLMEKCVEALGKRGRMVQIGVPDYSKSITIPLADFFQENKTFEVHFLGDTTAQKTLPRMIQWYKEGKFPIDKIIRFYHVDKVLEALEDMKTEVIKPILVF